MAWVEFMALEGVGKVQLRFVYIPCTDTVDERPSDKSNDILRAQALNIITTSYLVGIFSAA
jgi:hypothetical protein